MYRISQLFIYPIKSLGGISLHESRVEARGLAYDRRWMLCDENMQFITQREHKELTLFKLQQIDSGFAIEYISERFQIPFGVNGTSTQVKIWDDVCDAIEFLEGSIWFTSVLGYTCKLYYMPNDSERKVDEKFAKGKHINSFSDAFPILIAGQQSLNQLNLKMKQAIDINRFRPNIVFDGGEPFCEDNFRVFSIHKTILQCVKPCARCQVIGINQTSSEINTEPLKVLATFRTQENKIMFGQNVIVIQAGELIKVDDLLIAD